MNKNYILYFDGECIFCDAWIRFFYKIDKQQKFLFCALQSETARAHLGPSFTNELSTVVLQDITQQKIYTKSSAVIRALNIAHPLFKIFSVFLLIPPLIRDSIYNGVAKNRYKIFGKKELCAVDASLDRSRFIIK